MRSWKAKEICIDKYFEKFVNIWNMNKQLKKDFKKNNATKEDISHLQVDIQDLKSELKYVDLRLRETKMDINQQIRSTHNYLEHETSSIKKTLNDFIGEFHKLKNWMYDKLDWLTKSYEKFDQEHTIASEQYRESSDKMENHEIRITALEKKTVYKTS